MPEPSDRSAHESVYDARNSEIKIYVDGEIVHRDDAKVSVYDSGFLLGDGVWEGLRLHRGRISFLEEHLDRLFEAAIFLEIDIRKTKQQIAEAVQAVLDANGMTDNAHIRLMVTRGRKKKPFQDPRLSVYGPTVVIIAEHSQPSARAWEQGIRLHTVPHHRGLPLTQDPKLNSHSKLNCIIALNHALRAGADEALMLDPHGFVSTTNACNFFVVRHGEVWTSTGDYCMNGITRKKVVELCRSNSIPVFEKNFTLVEAYGAQEAFLTGTFGGPSPIFEIDGRIIGEGMPGPMLSRVRELYDELIQRDSASDMSNSAPSGSSQSRA